MGSGRCRLSAPRSPAACRSPPCPVWRCAIGTSPWFERRAKSARWCSTTSRCRRVTTSNRGGDSTHVWRTVRPILSRPRAAVRSAARSARSGRSMGGPSASARSTRYAGTLRPSAITCSSPTTCSGITRRAASNWRTSSGAAASGRNGSWSRAARIW